MSGPYEEFLKLVSDKNGIDPSSIDTSALAVGANNVVWYGYGPKTKGALSPGSIGYQIPGVTSSSARSDVTKTLQEAKNDITHWSYKDLQKFARSLYAQGIIPAPVVNVDQLAPIWEKMVTWSANYYQGGNGQRLSPWDILAKYMEPTGSGGQNGPTTQTNLFDAGFASQSIDDLLQQKLGRGATEGEKRAFVSALNSAMTANPQVTTTDANGNQTVQQGTDPGAYAQDYIKKNFGSQIGTYQAATTYFDALEQLLGGPPGGGSA